jgi:hypothetical protein
MIYVQMRRLSVLASMLFLVPVIAYAELATFDDLTLGADGYYNGSDGTGGFTSGGIDFVNNYNSSWGSWDGWAYSNKTDTTTPGYTNQYSAYTGAAAFGSQYGVYFEPFSLGPTVSLADNGTTVFAGAYFTNTTYAALAMLNGDSYATKFGGTTGNDKDWFLLTITGVDAQGADTGSVDFYLADYRFDNNSLDYIVNNWVWVDLSGLGEVAGLKFDLSSSDVGSYGMNTPAFFAMDHLEAVPEPGTLVLSLVGVAAGISCWGIRRRRAMRKR